MEGLHLLGTAERARALAEHDAEVVLGQARGTHGFEGAVHGRLEDAWAEAERLAIREGMPVHVLGPDRGLALSYAFPPGQRAATRRLAFEAAEREYALAPLGAGAESVLALAKLRGAQLDSLAKWWLADQAREREGNRCLFCDAEGTDPVTERTGTTLYQHPAGTSCFVASFRSPY